MTKEQLADAAPARVADPDVWFFLLERRGRPGGIAPCAIRADVFERLALPETNLSSDRYKDARTRQDALDALRQLAREGPLIGTILDACVPGTNVGVGQVIYVFPCDESRWARYLEERK